MDDYYFVKEDHHHSQTEIVWNNLDWLEWKYDCRFDIINLVILSQMKIDCHKFYNHG